MLGRTFAADEHQTGRNRVVLLSHHLWQMRFGSNPAIGWPNADTRRQSIRGGRRHAASHRLSVAKGHLGSAGRRRRLAAAVAPCAVLPGDRAVEARRDDRSRAELATIAEGLAASYPRTNKGVGITVAPLFDRVTGPIRPALLLLLGGVTCLLFIACANAANLMLARAAARQGESTVRKALGGEPLGFASPRARRKHPARGRRRRDRRVDVLPGCDGAGTGPRRPTSRARTKSG